MKTMRGLMGLRRPKGLTRTIRKYWRWYWLYLKRVKLAEQETGGELQACG